MNNRIQSGLLLAAAALAVLACSAFAQEKDEPRPARQGAKSPVKVFILAGQSNMLGYGLVSAKGKSGDELTGTLAAMQKDPAKAPLVQQLFDRQGAPAVRDDVWVDNARDWPKHTTRGPLGLGYGADGNNFGPEVGFGHVIGDMLDNQVLIIKTAWGGKSLYGDFRPPSSGGKVGANYTQMIATVQGVLANLKSEFPAYDGGGYELSGFVWWHGWNDHIDACNHENESGPAEYERNLVNLVRDLRKDLNAPALPVVIGEFTGPYVRGCKDVHPYAATIRKAQASAAARPEFKGSAVFVPTQELAAPKEESPGPWEPHHEYRSAETYYLIGKALGKGMRTLLKSSPSLSAAEAGSPLSADSQLAYDTKVKPFLAAYCIECHDGDDAQANFRIDNLATDFLVGKTGDNWKEIYDNISLGKMPKKKKLVGAEIDEANAVTDWIAQEIRNVERRAKNASGRNPMRRLNRSEYVNSLRDLFALDDGFVRSLEEDLQPDGTFAGFDRVSSSLYLDAALLHRYYELADKVLNRHVFRPNPNTRKVRDYARDIKWQSGHDMNLTKVASWPRILTDHVDMRAEPVLLPTGATAYTLKNGGIEYLVGVGHIGDHSGTSGSGAGGGKWGDNVLNLLYGVQESGLYRFKFRAGAYRGKGKLAVDDVKLIYEYTKNRAQPDTATVVIDAPLDRPRDYEFSLFIHHWDIPNGLGNRFTWNGITADGDVIYHPHATDKHVVIEAPELAKAQTDISLAWNNLIGQRDAARNKGDKATVAKLTEEMKLFAEKGAKEVHQFMLEYKGPAYVYNPSIDLQSIPRLWLEYLEVEGPIVEWPSRGRQMLFFAGEQRTIDKTYIREIFARFLPRAYRRPIEPAELDTVVAWVSQNHQRNQLSGADAVKQGVRAVLCSPEFLLIEEPADDSGRPRKLNDYELASRLSYFLWSSMPDEELFRLAASSTLHEPITLKTQVTRMIADPKAMQFVRNFAGQWLKVRDFDNTKTDPQYSSYTDKLRKSSWQEPYEFFNEVLRSNLSILNFVDSDFLMIDECLARHYGIDGVKGDQFRKVAVRPEHHRGGILGMAGVLTYLTDGFRTLPVRRAAYVLDTLWNEPPKPPPPGAGDLPAVKGQNLTVRQRLQQHRDSMMCASCHARIDGFGIALENYDAIGSWRERQNGEGLQGDDRSPPLDVSGELRSRERNSPGRKFSNLAEYKQSLLAEKDRFLNGFTEKMLTYALCRPISRTADRAIIEQVIKQLEQDQNRMQSLVQAIVANEAFTTK